MRIEDFDRAKVLVERLQEMRALHPKLERASDRHPFFIMHIPAEVLKFVPAVEAANVLLPLLETEIGKTERELQALGVTLPPAEEAKPPLPPCRGEVPPKGYARLAPDSPRCRCSNLWTDGHGVYWCCCGSQMRILVGKP